MTYRADQRRESSTRTTPAGETSRHARRQAHEVVGLGSRGRRLPPRGQAGASARSSIEAVDVDVDTPSRPRPMKLDDLDRPRAQDQRRAAGRAERRRRRGERASTTTSTGSCTPTARACATCSGCAPATSRGCPTWSSIPADEAEVQLDRRPGGRGQRGADPVRRRQQHLRQPAGAGGRDPAGDLGRPRSARTRCSTSTTSPGWPGSRPAPSDRTSRSSSRPRAGPSATSPTASPTARSAAGSRPGRRACSRTSTATSPTSPAGCASCCPGKVLVLRPLPSTSTGPSVREMILGSEGRLGVITEVTVQVHRIPEERQILGYLFPTWDAGLAAMQEISTSDARPIDHPGVRRPRDQVLLRHPEEEPAASRSPRWSARA